VIHREREINFMYVGISTLSIPVVCTNNRQTKEPSNERIHHSIGGLQGRQFQLVFVAVTTNYGLVCKMDTDDSKNTPPAFAGSTWVGWRDSVDRRRIHHRNIGIYLPDNMVLQANRLNS